MFMSTKLNMWLAIEMQLLLDFETLELLEYSALVKKQIKIRNSFSDKDALSFLKYQLVFVDLTSL